MNIQASTFPLNGVIGIVSKNKDEIDKAALMKLTCVEIRGDLVLDNNHSEEELFAMVRYARSKNLGCLLTIRLPSHGGTFNRSEMERLRLNEQGIDAGAHIIDLEWGSDAAAGALKKGLPLILSHHDFKNMLDESALEDLTEKMSAMKPLAIKIVPTGTTSSDGLTMLRWVSAQTDECRRIGFSMGAAGEFSRVLTCALGAPISYASFGDAVAPGQVPIKRMTDNFDVGSHNLETKIYVSLTTKKNPEFVNSINQIFRQSATNAVFVELTHTHLVTLDECGLLNRFSGIFIDSSERLLQPSDLTKYHHLRCENQESFSTFIANSIEEFKES